MYNYKNVNVMKTSVTMIRPLDIYKVEQRTKDGMFNATSLLKQWNETNGTKRELKDYFSNLSTQLFIEELKNELKNNTDNQTFPNRDNFPHLELIENQDKVLSVTSDKNELKTVYQTTRGNNGGTFMHPYLFFDFAMWLNPKFKVQVIKFVFDELIELRNDAGDKYKLLTAAASIFPDVDYAHIDIGLNWIVFHNHFEGIRQTATTEQLKELKDIQSNLAYAIHRGYIKNFPSLIQEMRDLYSEKYAKF